MEADAEHLPFEDGAFDVVMSAIGVMFAPHHQAAADELVRVCRPGRHGRAAQLDAGGDAGRPVPHDEALRRPAAARCAAAAAVGQRGAPAGLFGERVDFHTLQREELEITAFPRARDYGEHFKAYYGPTIAVRANAAKDGRAEEFDEALDQFCDRWNVGTADEARFEKEYLLAVGTRQ